MKLYNNNDLDLVDKNIDKIIETIEELRKKLHPRPQDNPENSSSETESESDTNNDSTTETETTIENNDSNTKSTEPTTKSNPEQNIENQQIQPPQPTKEDIDNIVKITMKFISDKKRKIYGGYAQNKCVSLKNKADAFYSDNDIPDIDVYSPTPIEDLVELCNTLHDSGYTDVIGKEAMHKETYKIFTKGYNAIDLSYVPKQIYDNIPFIESDNIRYVNPSFAMIDLYRMMSEPLFSSWRWKKIFNRLFLLQKHFPFADVKYNQHSLKHQKLTNDTFQKLSNDILDFVTNNNSIYVIGDFAYNELVKFANMKEVRPINIHSYQIISTDYKNNAVNLIKKLNEIHKNITHEEFYPFWSFTDYSVEIYCEGELIVKMYNNLKRCCPVKSINIGPNKTIQIGSFDFIFLMEMINSFREKVSRNNNKKIYHDSLISNLIRIREYYFNTNKKTLLDDTLFQSFIDTCAGDSYDPIMEAKKQRKERKKKTGSALFIYKPIRELKTKWIFANTSGNLINNPKNLKLRI